MGERTEHPPGTFSWTDLGTSDAEGAKAFYTGLFGWEAEDSPVPGGGTYTMFKIDGKAVSGLYERDDLPPAWLSYVTVEDADATAGRAKELGGNVLQDPFDVMEAGRMAVLQDPQGAAFAVWQPKDSIGAELVNDAGSLTMNQLNTSDTDAATEFYSALFGWDVRPVTEEGGPDFYGLYNGDTLNGGMMPLPPDSRGTPPHWLGYFTVEDADDSARRIGEGGGQVVVPPMEIPAGRIVVAQDPQGAFFALFEGEVDP
jgi:predicted enzyme related to lactoylglutathione lyase